MLEYRLHARLRAYVNGVFPTKLSELNNDIPLLAAIPQTLSEAQKRQALANQDATRILAENFLRWDVATAYTQEQQARARANIDAVGSIDLTRLLDDVIRELQDGIDAETEARGDADDAIIEELGKETQLEGFGATAIKPALNEVKKGYDNCADNETIIKTNTTDAEIKPLKAIAIKDFLPNGTERKVVPQDIVNLEIRVADSEAEIEKIIAVGGYITPYNFGWSGGTVSSLGVGSTFEEEDAADPTKKRIITIVAEGQGDYPQGTNITESDAKVKAQKFQTDLTAWAAEDIWNETYSKYGDDTFPFMLEVGKAITLWIGKGIKTSLPIGYWESVGTDTNGNDYGLWVTDRGDGLPRVNIGRFAIVDEVASGQNPWVIFNAIDDLSTKVINYWNNTTNDSDITLHSIVRKEYEVGEDEEVITSGIDWAESFLYWKGHSPIELFNGTKCINAFNKWIWQISNTPETSPSVFDWGLADIGAGNIGYATDTMAGVVKILSTKDDTQTPQVTKYGILLDANNQMYVDRLGEDLNEIRTENQEVASLLVGREEDVQELYDDLVAEGWITPEDE